jgi:hypothetical protein
MGVVDDVSQHMCWLTSSTTPFLENTFETRA